MEITSVPGGNKVVLYKSISKYAAENVMSQHVQWVGNNGTGATQSTYKLQRVNFLVIDKVTVPPPPDPAGWTRGGGVDTGGGGGAGYPCFGSKTPR